MPFEKGDERINRLERTPEKFTKEFVDYVVEMKQLVAEERVRLENIMENENAFC